MKKTLSRILVISIVLFVVAAEIFPDTFRNLVDAVSYPWAHSFLGKPTLTGSWRGKINFADQDIREIDMEIERNILETIRPNHGDQTSLHGTFAGKAELPDEHGNWIRYELWGSANRSGSEITIQLRAIDRKPLAEQQALLQELNGEWKGGTLELRGKYLKILFDGNGSSLDVDQTNLPVYALLTRQ